MITIVIFYSKPNNELQPSHKIIYYISIYLNKIIYIYIYTNICFDIHPRECYLNVRYYVTSYKTLTQIEFYRSFEIYRFCLYVVYVILNFQIIYRLKKTIHLHRIFRIRWIKLYCLRALTKPCDNLVEKCRTLTNLPSQLIDESL